MLFLCCASGKYMQMFSLQTPRQCPDPAIPRHTPSGASTFAVSSRTAEWQSICYSHGRDHSTQGTMPTQLFQFGAGPLSAIKNESPTNNQRTQKFEMEL